MKAYVTASVLASLMPSLGHVRVASRTPSSSPAARGNTLATSGTAAASCDERNATSTWVEPGKADANEGHPTLM